MAEGLGLTIPMPRLGVWNLADSSGHHQGCRTPGQLCGGNPCRQRPTWIPTQAQPAGGWPGTAWWSGRVHRLTVGPWHCRAPSWLQPWGDLDIVAPRAGRAPSHYPVFQLCPKSLALWPRLGVGAWFAEHPGVGRGWRPPYEVAVLHPEDAFAAAVRHELTAQVSWPVWPRVRPAAVPGEAAPRVPEAQEPGESG